MIVDIILVDLPAPHVNWGGGIRRISQMSHVGKLEIDQSAVICY